MWQSFHRSPIKVFVFEIALDSLLQRQQICSDFFPQALSMAADQLQISYLQLLTTILFLIIYAICVWMALVSEAFLGHNKAMVWLVPCCQKGMAYFSPDFKTLYGIDILAGTFLLCDTSALIYRAKRSPTVAWWFILGHFQRIFASLFSFCSDVALLLDFCDIVFGLH
jgi:hypothetical protein